MRPTRQRRAFAVTAAIGALLVLVATAGAVRTAPTPRNGRIAWKVFLDTGLGTSAIFAANPDGSHRVQLTHPEQGVTDDLPDWSPDGSAIIFERIFQPNQNHNTVPDQTMRVYANGGGLTTIGDCRADCLANDDPSYSPDGRSIVISRAMLPIQPNRAPALGIWIMGADGSGLRQITQLQQPTSSEDHEPAWSPDGSQIVFTRINDMIDPIGQQALFVVSSAGGTPRRVTPWRLNGGGANWSPDGHRIVFQSYRDCHCAQISQAYAVDPDGRHLEELTDRGRNIEPNWSPDGRQIIFGHQPGAGPHQFADIWRMSATVRGNRQSAPIIRTSRWESEPDWGTAPLVH